MRVSSRVLTPDAINVDGLLAKYHLAIFGPTGSGKDILMEDFWARMSHAGVYFNVEEEPVKGTKATSARHVVRLLGDGHERIVLETPSEPEDMQPAVGELRDEVFELGEAYKGKKRSAPHFLNVFLPEVTLYSDKGDKGGPVPDLLRRGRKRGLRCVINSQSPADVSHVILKQARIRALFEFDDVELEYFRGYGIPVDEFREHVAQPHAFVLVNGNRWTPYQPVPLDE